MHLIIPEDLLGFLGDGTAFIRRQQLGTDGGVQNIPENGSKFRIGALLCQHGNNPADGSLGHCDIDIVSRQGITAEGAPAQCLLGEVAGTHCNAADLVAEIQQDLGAFRAWAFS